jgi:hypothetical protein
MSRFVQAANEAAFVAEHIDYAVMCELNFVSGLVRAHLGVGDIVVNGNTYTGLGKFGSISSITERPDGRDYTQLRLGVSGVDPSVLALVPDRSQYFNRYASIYMVAFNTATMQPITPTEAAIFQGFMDSMSYQRSQGAATIQLIVKHWDSIYAESIDLWYTNDHHQSIYTGDLLFDQVPAIQDKDIVWGGAAVETGRRRDRDRGGNK